MAMCAEVHRAYDGLANGPVQIGELPGWMHVRGRAVWYVYAGAYRDISEKGWGAFMQKVRASGHKPLGPPGDVYVCDPDEHKDDGQRTMITILWAPLE